MNTRNNSYYFLKTKKEKITSIVSNVDQAEIAANLFQIEPEELIKSLTNLTIEIRGEFMDRPFSVEKAEAARFFFSRVNFYFFLKNFVYLFYEINLEPQTQIIKNGRNFIFFCLLLKLWENP